MSQNYRELYQSKFVVGRGSIHYLKTLGKRKAAFFFDSAVVPLEDQARIVHDLSLAGCKAAFLVEIKHEPYFSDLYSAIKAVRDFSPDLIVSLGGGSVIDLAKATHVLYEHPDLEIMDLFKPFQLPPLSRKALHVAIPSTSGTGSETTCAAVLTDDESQRKHLMLDFGLIPTYALLDPNFCDSLPAKIAAHSGMDALVHAIEAAICKTVPQMTALNAIAAALELFEYLPVSVSAPHGPARDEARERCHYAASLAGVAINNSSAGLVHALDQMGPYFSLPHGLVCGILIPYVVAFLAPHPVFSKLARHLGYSGDDTRLAIDLINHLWQLNSEIGIAHGFAEMNIDEAVYLSQIDAFVSGLEHSMAANLSPHPPTKEEAKAILTAAYYGEKPGIL